MGAFSRVVRSFRRFVGSTDPPYTHTLCATYELRILRTQPPIPVSPAPAEALGFARICASPIIPMRARPLVRPRVVPRWTLTTDARKGNDEPTGVAAIEHRIVEPARPENAPNLGAGVMSTAARLREAAGT